MPALTERVVQKTALQYLKRRYSPRARGRIFARMEVRTKKQFGAKRADGLLAYKHWLGGLEVVSMEAKSSKTLPHVRPYFDSRTLVRNCLWFATVVTIVTGAAFFFFKFTDGFLQYLIPINVFVISGLGYGFISWYSHKHRQVPVLDQLSRYPGNFQWLALSQDAFDGLKYGKAKNLLRLCRRRGYGLLLVNSRKQVISRIKPRRRYRIWGNFLRFYSKEREIMGEIGWK